MSSQALALKYRPQSLEAVVGQETTVRILRNSLDQKRIHHAYLFSGPRGIGKTSLARIFARALNCADGPTSSPCGTCVPCQEVAQGRSLAVLEIDGASNNLVEDVRDLREKIHYLPQGGRYKVYIIDEVHMLSKPAFNALLKTLEEPPPHAVFLFATTEPDKVPSTVLSRVIRFDLRPIPATLIAEQLRRIARSESLEIEDKALFLISQEAQGGLRDAVSLLEQVVSFSGPKVSETAVEEVVGVSTRGFVLGVIRSILQKDAGTALKSLEEASAAGIEIKKLTGDLLKYLRHLVVARVSQDPALFDLPMEEMRELADLAQGVSAEDLDRIFQIFQRGSVEVIRSALPRVLLDVLLVRLCQFEGLRPLDEILRLLEENSPRSPAQKSLFETQVSAGTTTPTSRPPTTDAPPSKGWNDFLSFLKSKRPHIHSLIREGTLSQLGDSEVVLHFPASSIQLTLLQEPDRTQGLLETMHQFFGKPLSIRYETRTGSEPMAPQGPPRETGHSPLVDEAIAIFGPKTVMSPVKKIGDPL